MIVKNYAKQKGIKQQKTLEGFIKALQTKNPDVGEETDLNINVLEENYREFIKEVFK